MEEERETERERETTKFPVGRTGFVREACYVAKRGIQGEIMNVLHGVGLSRMDSEGEQANTGSADTPPLRRLTIGHLSVNSHLGLTRSWELALFNAWGGVGTGRRD